MPRTVLVVRETGSELLDGGRSIPARGTGRLGLSLSSTCAAPTSADRWAGPSGAALRFWRRGGTRPRGGQARIAAHAGVRGRRLRDSLTMLAMSDEPTVFRPDSVSYLRIPAPDPAETAAFYGAVFDWEVDPHEGASRTARAT
jgi:hypothetical protein